MWYCHFWYYPAKLSEKSSLAVPVACFLIHAPFSCCSRGVGNKVSRDGCVEKWQHKEQECKKEREWEDDRVRRSEEFDSSSCQRGCIIDVLRIPHCRQDSQYVTSRPVCVCVCAGVCVSHTSLLWSHKSHRSATCQHLHITGSSVSDNSVYVGLTTWEGCSHTHTHFYTDLWDDMIVS